MDQDGNPFRPNGILAKEADEVVNLIKQGKLTPSSSPVCERGQLSKKASTIEATADQPDKAEAKKKKKSKKGAEEIEVNKSIIQDKDPSYPEHVTLPEEESKKKESLCCVIQ